MLEIRSSVFIKSEPAEETHLFASSQSPPMSTNPVLSIGGQDAASGQAAFARPFISLSTRHAPNGQTGGAKRVRFAPVAKYDEHICGING